MLRSRFGLVAGTDRNRMINACFSSRMFPASILVRKRDGAGCTIANKDYSRALILLSLVCRRTGPLQGSRTTAAFPDHLQVRNGNGMSFVPFFPMIVMLGDEGRKFRKVTVEVRRQTSAGKLPRSSRRRMRGNFPHFFLRLDATCHLRTGCILAVPG